MHIVMCAAGEVKATPRVNPWNEIVDELVARRSFYLLLAEEEDSCRRFATVLKKLEPLPSVDESQQRVVEGSSERIVHLIYSSPQPAPWKANDFTSRGWEIDSTNVYREFSRVAEVLFEDEINWGRIVAFLGFAVSFSVYAVQKGLQESVFESVLGWTVQVMQGRLKSWLREHSWVRNYFYVHSCMVFSM